LLLALTGCQGRAPVNQTLTNGNGSIAVSLPAKTNATDDANDKPSATNTDSADNTDSANEDSINTTAPNDSNDILEIKEKMFIAQTNDIYFNAKDYLGKTIKYEGMFQEHTVPETGVTYRSVIRYGPGCCGIDANAGFELTWPNGKTDYPSQDDWVEAVGVLTEYEEDGSQYLRLALTSLTVLDTRGAEYVDQ
jgi:uncharacterized membrane protein YcgQ (UPF0703/DUF1980 family)